MSNHQDYDDRLNPFADDGHPVANAAFIAATKSAVHASENVTGSHSTTKRSSESNNPFEDATDRASFSLDEEKHASSADKTSGDHRAETNEAALKANAKSGKSTVTSRPPPLTNDSVARFLLDNQLLLSALEFYTELLDHKIVVPNLRDFFSNPGNFELPLAGSSDTNAHPGSSRVSSDGHINSKPGGNGDGGNLLFRAGSYSTLSDSVSLADVDLIGARRDDIVGGNTEAVPSGRIGLLEYELRKARETIQQLRDSLTTAATTSAVPNRSNNNPENGVDGEAQAEAPSSLSRPTVATADGPDDEKTVNSVRSQSIASHHPLQRHELRALNFLVSEYLVEHGYKLTSITFSDENPEQDFDDWDDVGLNTAKPDSLVSIFEQHVAGVTRGVNNVDIVGNFHRQSSCRTIVGRQAATRQHATEQKQPITRKDSASQTHADESVNLAAPNDAVYSKDSTKLEIDQAKPQMQDFGIQVDFGPSSEQQITGVFATDGAATTHTGVESPSTTSRPKLHAPSLVRNEMYRPDQFQTTLLRYLLTSSSLINISPSVAAASLDADELRIHSVIDSISPTSLKTDDEAAVEQRRTTSLSVSCLKFIVPNIILAKRQEIIPILVEAYLFLHIPHSTSNTNNSPDAVEIERENLLKQLFNIVNKPDDSQRRLLLKALQKICYYSSAQRLENQLLPLCWSQASHKYAERRQLVAEACAIVSQYVTNEMNSSLISSTLKQMWSEERVVSVRRSIALGLGVCCSRLYDEYDEISADIIADDDKFTFVHALFWQCVTSASEKIISDVGFQGILPLCAYLALKRRRLLRYVEVEFLNRLRHLTRRHNELLSPVHKASVVQRTTSVVDADDDDDDNLSNVEVESRILILLQSLHALCTPVCAQLIASAPESSPGGAVSGRKSSTAPLDDDSQQIFKLKLFVQQIFYWNKSKSSSSLYANDLAYLLDRFNTALTDHFAKNAAEKNEQSSAWNDLLLWASDVFVQQLAKICVNMPSNNTKFIGAMCTVLFRLVDMLNSRILAQKTILPTLKQHFEQAVCSRIFSRAAIFPVYFVFSMSYFSSAEDSGHGVDAGVADAISQLNTLMLATASPPPPVSSGNLDDENQQQLANTVCADGFIYIFKQIFFFFNYTSTSLAQLQRNEAIRLLQQLARHPSQHVQLLVAKVLADFFETVFSTTNPIAVSQQTKQTLIDGLSDPLFQLAADAVDAETRRVCVIPLVLLLRNSYNTAAVANSSLDSRILSILTSLFDEQKPNSSENAVDVAAECVFALNAVDGAITLLDYDSFQHFLLPRLSFMVARNDVPSTFSTTTTNSRRRAELCAALLQAYVSVTCSPHFAHSPPIKTSVKQSLLRLQRELQQQQQQLTLSGGSAAAADPAAQQQQQEYLHLCQSLLDKCHFVTTSASSATGGEAGAAGAGAVNVMNKLKGMQPFSRGASSKQ